MTVHLIPTIHPAAIFHGGRGPIIEVIAKDLAKAWRVANLGFSQRENLIVIHPSVQADLDGAVRAAMGWMDYWQIHHVPVSTDVETSSTSLFRCDLFSVALAGLDGNDVSLSFTFHDLHTLPWEAERVLVEKFKVLMADPNVPKVFQNGSFDRSILGARGYYVFGKCIDTIALHHLVQPDMQHDLGWQGHTYLDVEPWKLDADGEGLGKKFINDVPRGLVYNCKDALNTGKLVSPLLQDVYERGMTQPIIDLQHGLVDLCTIMSLRGMPVSHVVRNEMGRKLKEQIAKLTHELREMLAWPDFNPLNNNHRIAVYYEDEKYLRLKPTAWSEKTHAPSTSYKNPTIIENLEHPIVNKIVKVQELQTKYATWYDPAGSYSSAIEHDGRIHSKWSLGQMGSRVSSKPNVQNLQLADREFIEAPDGWVLVGADKDQLELRIAACRAGIEELMKEMLPGGDPHTMLTRKVWGPEYDTWPKDKRKKLRDANKNVVYASIYEATIATIWHTCREKKILSPEMRAMLTKPFVAHVFYSTMGKYWELKSFYNEKWSEVQSTGRQVVPPLGRTRVHPVPGLANRNEVDNYEVQPVGSDYVALAMLRIQHELEKPEWENACIIHHGHDAVLVECREHLAEKVQKLVNDEFGSDVLDGPKGPVTLSAKAVIGKNWKQCK